MSNPLPSIFRSNPLNHFSLKVNMIAQLEFELAY